MQFQQASRKLSFCSTIYRLRQHCEKGRRSGSCRKARNTRDLPSSRSKLAGQIIPRVKSYAIGIYISEPINLCNSVMMGSFKIYIFVIPMCIYLCLIGVYSNWKGRMKHNVHAYLNLVLKCYELCRCCSNPIYWCSSVLVVLNICLQGQGSDNTWNVYI